MIATLNSGSSHPREQLEETEIRCGKMLWEEQALRERGLDGDGKRLPACVGRKAQAKEARAGSPQL